MEGDVDPYTLEMIPPKGRGEYRKRGKRQEVKDEERKDEAGREYL
jgi:hypothetical protein